MSIQSFAYNYNPSRKLVDGNGVPFQDGRDFLLALFNRTGAGTGIIPKVTGPLIATGSTIVDSLQLGSDWNLIGTTPLNSGVQLLPLKPGNDIQVFNAGANPLNIYPPGGSQIDALAINSPLVLLSGKLRIFECWTLSQFFSLGN